MKGRLNSLWSPTEINYVSSETRWQDRRRKTWVLGVSAKREVNVERDLRFVHLIKDKPQEWITRAKKTSKPQVKWVTSNTRPGRGAEWVLSRLFRNFPDTLPITHLSSKFKWNIFIPWPDTSFSRLKLPKNLLFLSTRPTFGQILTKPDDFCHTLSLINFRVLINTKSGANCYRTTKIW